jgi:hypothetical protein
MRSFSAEVPMSRFSRALLFLLATLLVTAPAMAELYTVRLKNGNTIDSRQQPQFAAWDKDVVLVLTDVANWVALEAKDIERVDVETQVRGFAKRLDANTLFLGWSANDGTGDRGGVVLPENQRNYDQKQFVSPSEAGGGFPAFGGGQGSSGGSSGPVDFVPPAAPSAPAAPPPSEGGTQ